MRPQQWARLGILAPWREASTSSSAKCVDRASHPWRWICAEDPSVAFLIAQGRPACVIRIIRAHAGQEGGWCLARGHLNWSLRRWRISLGGEWTEGCSSLREQNEQRHVSIVCIKKCKPEDIFPCMSKCGLVCLLQSALFLYPLFLKSLTLSLLRTEEDQEEAVFREVVSFTPDPLPGEKDRGSEHLSPCLLLELLDRAAPSLSQVFCY